MTTRKEKIKAMAQTLNVLNEQYYNGSYNEKTKEEIKKAYETINKIVRSINKIK